MLTVSPLLVFGALALSGVSGTFRCLCSVNHPQVEIASCPDFMSLPIASLYTPDYLHMSGEYRLGDLQQDNCKAIVSNVATQDPWVAVYVQNSPIDIGYVFKDSGLQITQCNGHVAINNNNITTSPRCPAKINSISLNNTAPVKPPAGQVVSPTPGFVNITLGPLGFVNITSARPVFINATSATPGVVNITSASPGFVNIPSGTPGFVNIPSGTPGFVNIPSGTPGFVNIPSGTPGFVNIPSGTKTTTPPPATPHFVPIVSQHNNMQCLGTNVDQALLRQLTVYHSKARSCGHNGISTEEAVLYWLCGAPSLDKWSPVIQVKGNCNNLPKYSPVAVFRQGKIENGDGSGILVGCTTTGGAKIARQTCQTSQFVVEIVEDVRSTDVVKDLENYYVVA